MKLGRREIAPGLVVIAVKLNVMPAVRKVPIRFFGDIFKPHEGFLAYILGFVDAARILDDFQLEATTAGDRDRLNQLTNVEMPARRFQRDRYGKLLAKE